MSDKAGLGTPQRSAFHPSVIHPNPASLRLPAFTLVTFVSVFLDAKSIGDKITERILSKDKFNIAGHLTSLKDSLN